ncbi:MAG: 3-phenylpropionate/trans-cinnamate dioxygenase ferredoxin subunit [Gammaproteobacteria bacterium]|jgi:3-phenylpropionate/trans-cinnamate dioxygenase ferredoxin subunit
MSSSWIDVVAVTELGPGKSHFIEIGDLTVAVFNLQGEYYAIEDACSHDGSRMLSCGVEARFIVHGERIMCPRHGAEFCIRTGAVLSRPAREDLATFPIRVENEHIQVYCQVDT